MSAELDGCVDFLQRLIRTPSLPGEEGDLAALVGEEMEALGYDSVEVDEVGNVIGRVTGRGAAPPVMFNTHLDHVDVGDAARWPHPPFGAEIHDDAVWGRGAVDIKGPLAAQVHGVARLTAEDTRPPGDVIVSAVVQEEIGGIGARWLADHLQVPTVIVGEPSSNTLRRGHRGRSEIIVHLRGRSVHASVPGKGVNPYYTLAGFLAGLRDLEMATHEDLGASSVAPTLIRTDQTSGNVIPGEIWLTCDWRHIPGESAEDAREMLERLLAKSLVDGAEGEIVIPTYRRRTYTGMELEMRGNNPAYVLPADHPALRAARRIVEPVLGTVDEVGLWRFATDSGHFSAAGMACVGFGPGDELLAHTVNEHLPLSQLATAIEVNARLGAELGAATASS